MKKTTQLKDITLHQGDCMDYIKEKEIISNLYFVSNDGKVIRKRDNKELKSSVDNKGYKRIRIKVPHSKNNDGRKTYKIHRLVSMFYIENYTDKLQVNHINGDKADNHYTNLEMVTNSQNAYHGWNNLDSTKRRYALYNRKDKVTGRFI